MILPLTACVSADPAPLDLDRTAALAVERDGAAPKLALALELAGASTIDLRPGAKASDPSHPAYWEACALAWNPEVRAARREVEITRASARAAGFPGAMTATATTAINGDNRESEVMATLDLLGVLGLGPTAAARDLANEEALAAHAEFEAATWAATFSVARARVELAAARAKAARLGAVLADAEADWKRALLLAERGRVANETLGTARSILHRLHGEKERLAVEVAVMRAELGVESGLGPAAPPLDGVGEEALDDAARFSAPLLPEPPNARALLDRHPELRSAKRRYAVAEAAVRRAAAESWPMIGVGPNFVFMPDLTLAGGVLDVQLPWPGAAARAVDVAVEGRTKAREALEDALLARSHAVAKARATLERERRYTTEHASGIADGAAVAWRAVRARFAVDPMALSEWMMDLERRAEAEFTLIDARRNLAKATLAAIEAEGPELSEPTLVAGGAP